MADLFLFLGSIILLIVLLFFLGLISSRHFSKKQINRKLEEIYEASPFREGKKKPPKKPKDSNDFRARDERKEVVTGKAPSKEYEKLAQKEKKFQEEELEKDPDEPREGLVTKKVTKQLIGDNTKIVGLAEPKGFWTRLVMSRSIEFLLNFGQESRKGPGYFQNLIKARAKSQGKEKGRGL
jgi:hypothetical protein